MLMMVLMMMKMIMVVLILMKMMIKMHNARTLVRREATLIFGAIR